MSPATKQLIGSVILGAIAFVGLVNIGLALGRC